MSGEGVRFGEFLLLRRLGAGGMAEVFLARREGPEGFEKQLVVKRLLPHLARSERSTQMLLREARYAALIDHPNFVHVSSFGVIDDGYYLAMEYVDGLTIKEVLEVVDSLSPGVAARIAIDLLDALHAIHTAKYLDGRELHLVHRDVTPGNVMITASGTVKVLDLGIAVPSNEVAPVRAGTRRYMSPEQSRGETLDARSDLYCVGLLLCLMLSGRHPFVVGELASTLEEAPPVLREVIIALLQQDRELRPSSAREIQERLEEFAVTRGREGTRAFLSEFAADIAGSRPPPRPRGEETASCLLSSVVADFVGNEAPTNTEYVRHREAILADTRKVLTGPLEEATAVGPHPEPPRGSEEEVEAAGFVQDSLQKKGPPAIEDSVDTLELSQEDAKEALQADVWPVPLEDLESDALAEDVEPVEQTVVPTVVELDEPPEERTDSDTIGPTSPTRAGPTALLPTPDAPSIAALEGSKKDARVRRIALRLSLVAIALASFAAWGSWAASQRKGATPGEPGPALSSATTVDPVAAAPRADSEAVLLLEAQGYLELDVQPRAEVIIDGRPVGRTPLRKLELDPGSHRVRLINAEAGVDAIFGVEVNSGKTTRVRRRFGPQP